MVLAGMLAPIFMNGGDNIKSDEPDIKALEIDDVRQYKFTDKENNVGYVITDKPDGATVKRKNIN
jgi:hypothetical protein